MKKKWRFIRYVKRITPKGIYRRLLIGRKVVFGKNEHEFKGQMTKHYHIGEKFIKIATQPKKLRGVWRYNRKREEYVRVKERREIEKGSRR